MDIQFALLSMLSCRPMAGYDMKKVIQESPYLSWSGNNNQIYKALLLLQQEGFVQCEVQHQQGAPDKKVYTVTQEGREELKGWLMSSSEPFECRKAFLMQLFCADMLTPDELQNKISGYENEIRMQMAMQGERMRRGGGFEARTPREALLWQLIDENVLNTLRAELDWAGRAKERLFESGLNEEEIKMEYSVIDTQKGRYVEVRSSPEPIGTEQGALDLVALCGANDTTLLMLHEAALSEEFFRLRTGVAGVVMQKLVNYYVRTAVVMPDTSTMRGKFRDMAAEAGRGSHLRIFENRQDAESWLLR